MRRGIALLFVALAGCSRAGDEPHSQKIDCAIGGASTFAPDCSAEKAVQGTRHLIVVRHKDGGFRRFEAVADGRGVASADGSEPSTAQWIADGRLQVSVGADRYLFPAKRTPGDGPTR
jgi:hypothetical protein